MKAIYRRARISPKKANLVAGMIRGKGVIEALTLLKFTPKKGADLLYKTLKSAVANAENNAAQNKNKLIIKQILVSPGPVFKRGIPISKGQMHPILKRNSHITVELEINTEAVKELVTDSESSRGEQDKKVKKPKTAKKKDKTPIAETVKKVEKAETDKTSKKEETPEEKDIKETL